MLRYSPLVPLPQILPKLKALDDAELDGLLKGVSRSFYLSLALLPTPVRAQLSVAYLIARALDTIADTAVLGAASRLQLLSELKAALPDAEQAQRVAAKVMAQLNGKSRVAKENELMATLDRALVHLHRFDPFDALITERVLQTLASGMERDLRRFSHGFYVLETLAELDEHCYAAAGCVGDYWTQLTHHHLHTLQGISEQTARGVRLGKALQYTNVIRDIASDLRDNRCYVPRELLAAYGLEPLSLLHPTSRLRAKPLLRYLIDLALSHYDAGFAYVAAIPPSESRLRLTVLLPLWIGLETLAGISHAEDPLDPSSPVRIDRRRVYRIMLDAAVAGAAAKLGSDSLLHEAHALRRRVATR